MKISLYGNYYIPYVIKYLEKEGHSVLFNQFSPDIDVCFVESRFFMYEIYRNLKKIKNNGIKLINSILDIPIFYLYKEDYTLNTLIQYLKQTMFNITNRNQFLFDRLNCFNPNPKKSRYSNFFRVRIQDYFNNQFLNRIYFLKNYRRFLKYSDLNLSLSKYTQKLVKKFLKIDSKVCYPCVNSDYLLSLPKSKIKYDAINISRIVPLKRQEIFIKAAKELGLNILVLGRHSDKSIKLDCPHFYFTDHNRVMKILNQAAFYVDPSEFEGFGMTPVEAAFLDKITIASNTYVHREILGDYAVYFEKNNVDDLVEKMRIVKEGGFQLKNAEILKKYSIKSCKNRLIKHIKSLF